MLAKSIRFAPGVCAIFLLHPIWLSLADVSAQTIKAIAPDPTGLLAHYAFEGNASNSSGLGPAGNGILVGGPTYKAGVIGQAIDLDGSGGYVNCGNGSVFNLTLQNVVFGGAAFSLSGTLRVANDSTAPLATSPMPQPDATIIWAVAFSPTSQRMAVSAGPDEDQTSLYVNSPGTPENFKVYWSPDTEVHGVTSLAWSHKENALAFIGMSGSRTTKTGEVWLYLLDIASGEIRKVLKIGEADQGKERRLVNVHEEQTVLAWLGNNRVCMPTRDNSIIAVDCNDGHIETLVPAQDCKIWGPVSVSSNKLRFLKRRSSGQGWEVEICDFNDSKVISCGIIPLSSEKTSLEWLSADGKYVFIRVMVNSGKTTIYDVSERALVKEIPIFAESGSEKYFYVPVTVLQGRQLVLLQIIAQPSKRSRQQRLVTMKL